MSHESVGTVRFAVADAATGGIQAVFIPDREHEVKHGDNSYAIFLPPTPVAEPGTDSIYNLVDTVRGGVPISIVPKDKISKTLKDSNLKVSEIALMFSVLSASTDQTKVKVTVEHEDTVLKLAGITVPT